mgnify:CR=1 FL=1
MNQISIAICDADSAYGNKLAEYLLETGNVAKAEVYTCLLYTSDAADE